MFTTLLAQLKKDRMASQLDDSTLFRLAKSEEQVQKIETKYTNKSDKVMDQLSRDVFIAFEENRLPDTKELGKLFADNYFETAFKAIEMAKEETELKTKRRLAVKVPKSFADLMKAYDLYRKSGKLPPKVKKVYERTKKEYLDKCRSAWDKYGEKYRTGETTGRVETQDAIREVSNTTAARAKTIVRTETTTGYNKNRKEYFDRSPDVGYYLFLAIRDKRTTCWCTEKTVAGKRGRHGLVYSKDDPLCDKETPACHWNCRSTMVPLTRFNPSHLKFIENKSIQRRNVVCFPLPVGWSNAA